MTSTTARATRTVIGWEARTVGALALLDVAVVAGLARLFGQGRGDDSWNRAAMGLVIVIHALGFLQRRTRIPAAVTAVGAVALAAFAVTRWFYPDTAWAGLPTTATARTFSSELTDALSPLRDAVAPLPLQPAMAAALTLGAAAMAAFTDAWTFRLESRAMALAAPIGVFLVSSVAARGIETGPASVSVLGAAALFWVVSSTHVLSRANGSAAVPVVSLQSTFALGLVAAVIGLAAAGAVTAATETDPVDARIDLLAIGRAPSPRTVGSPLVRVGSLLRNESFTRLFTVRSARPHYWRLTSLDRFDGDAWTTSARYERLSGGDRIDPPFASSGDSGAEESEITFGAFSTEWIPAPFAVVGVDAPIDLRVDRSSSSVFVDKADADLEDRTVVVRSIAPDDEPRQRRGAPSLADADREELTSLPARTSATVAETVASLTADRPDELTAARRFQDYFRSPERFRYDLSADYSRSSDPTRDFLLSGAGFCQQFASTFAAFAREAGIPARVAVGFTYGTPLDSTGETRAIEGRFAHAWPEVFIDGVGWLPFEPTPGRGNPDAEGVTGVPARQDGDGTAAPATTTTAPEGGSGETPSTAPPPTEPPLRLPSVPPEDPGGGPGGPPALLWVGLGVLATATLAVAGRWMLVAARSRRRRDLGRGPAAVIAELYRHSVRQLGRIGLPVDPTATPLAIGSTASHDLGLAPMAELGRLESDRRYSADPPDARDAALAVDAGEAVDDAVRRRLGLIGRLRNALDL